MANSPVAGGLSRALSLIGLVLFLPACQPVREPQTTSTAPAAGWPAFDYAAVEGPESAVYTLDASRSRVEVVVHPDGPLAKFGHDHVVVLSAPRGFLWHPADLSQARADLRFAVAGMQVDPPDARARHALDTPLDAATVAGTRDNLMLHVLDPQQWPWIDVSLTHFRREGEQLSALVAISVNGQHSQQRHSFALEERDGAVKVTGNLVLQQAELGLQPFSVLGGGLRVAQDMEVYFDLRGQSPF
ncbi:hypothetical protein [Haliea sp. E17]|uniref:hypothetical protein n=1 Tax=Haliea sp. E17 TaxID=3401576 RepID=UPI003AAD98F6